MDYAGSTYYYQYNLQGDVIALLDSTFTPVVTYTYGPWGTVENITDSTNINLGDINPFLYRGYYYDSDTSLYYLQSRYYDPATGRFINEDKYIFTGHDLLGYNMYTYALNNPIKFTDSSGGRPVINDWRTESNLERQISIQYLQSGNADLKKAAKTTIDIILTQVPHEENTKSKIIFHEKRVTIQNSFNVNDTNTMAEICSIISQVDGTNRTVANYIAEWRFHNFAYYIDAYKDSATHADLEYDGDERRSVRVLTWVFEYFVH